MSKNHYQRNKRSKKRRSPHLNVFPRILIYCEGESEMHYFRRFRVSSVKVEVKTIGGLGDPDELITKVLGVKRAASKGDAFDECWIVFDDDERDDVKINKAFSKANSLGIKCAYSNESFELWVLLHFKQWTRDTGRKDLFKEVVAVFEENGLGEYDKGLKELYAKVLVNQLQAFENHAYMDKYRAKQSSDLTKINPYTSVPDLVSRLNSCLR